MNETLIYILLFLAALAVLLQAVTLLRGRSGVQLMTQLEARLASLDAALERQEREIRGELARMRSESLETARGDRTEQTQALERLGQGLAGQVGQLGTLQAQQFEGFGQNLTRLTQSFDARVEQLRLTVETRLTAIQADNAASWKRCARRSTRSCMRRLSSASANRSSWSRSAGTGAHRGLGEMQTLAAGVGDLKKVLTNVKTRGTWGEVQLAALLDQVLTAEQYAEERGHASGQQRARRVRHPSARARRRRRAGLAADRRQVPESRTISVW
jgi:DNA recombination protein RmuC